MAWKIIQDEGTARPLVDTGNGRPMRKHLLELKECPVSRPAEVLTFLEKNVRWPSEGRQRRIRSYEVERDSIFAFTKIVDVFWRIWALVREGKVKSYSDLQIEEIDFSDVPTSSDEVVVWETWVLHKFLRSKKNYEELLSDMSASCAQIDKDGNKNPAYEFGIGLTTIAFGIMAKVWALDFDHGRNFMAISRFMLENDMEKGQEIDVSELVSELEDEGLGEEEGNLDPAIAAAPPADKPEPKRRRNPPAKEATTRKGRGKKVAAAGDDEVAA